jgi:hypothetical protein
VAEAVALPADDYGMWKNDLFAQRAKSRAMDEFCVDGLRVGFLEGKVGYRESLAIRTVGQPGVATHTDTTPPAVAGK